MGYGLISLVLQEPYSSVFIRKKRTINNKRLANSGFSCTIIEMTEEGAKGPLF
jgi:hypothetical protein